MEAKYIYNFRHFNAMKVEVLRVIASSVGLSYQQKEKRKLAKELAVIFYETGLRTKPKQFMEVD